MAFCTVLCSPVPKGTAGCDRGGRAEVPAAGTWRALDSGAASRLPLLRGLCVSLDLTRLELPRRVLCFSVKGCCLTSSRGIILLETSRSVIFLPLVKYPYYSALCVVKLSLFWA